MVPARYRVLAHTADVGIAAFGATIEEVFENAAFGMFALTFDLSAVPGDVERRVVAEGDDLAELLVAWLAALLTEAEIGGLALSRFAVDAVGSGEVRGRAWGAAAAGRELVGPPVKAVTYHALAVEPAPGGWEARVIFDV